MDMEGQLTGLFATHTGRRTANGKQLSAKFLFGMRSSKDWHLNILAEWLQPPDRNGSLCFQFEIFHAPREHEDLDYPTVFRVDDSIVLLIVV